FWAIAIRPGRPLAFGELRDGDRRVPVFGLPGNVVSSLVTFELFVRPALLRMQGRDEVARPRTKARLLEPIEKIASLRVFARGIHDPSAGTVRTTGPQGSGILRSLSLAHCLSELIPLTHPLPITYASVELAVDDDGIGIEATVATAAQTGVEMEALTAVTVAGLTLYDMLKAVERGARLTDVRLVEKTGGKSGTYRGK